MNNFTRTYQLFFPILFLTIFFSLFQLSIGRIAGNLAYTRNTKITDFHYSSARIDGITRLFNGTWIVISNGHYWMLVNDELPQKFNVRGTVSQLHSSMTNIDSVWIDPYIDEKPQLYLIENTPNHGLRVVCQESDKPFRSDSNFCHMPVNNAWHNALKDLDFQKPVDAVTWRNRTKEQNGGYWVFFQGHKMITIDPYDMHLRKTYDMRRWMNLSDVITAAHYDYERSIFHLFFENNGYRTWIVNETFMNKLPMGWDRAFLHGKLSQLMKINRDFFGFSSHNLVDSPQPYYERFIPSELTTSKQFQVPTIATTTTTTTTSTTTSTTTTTRRPIVQTSTESDMYYVTSRKNIFYNKNHNKNSNLREHANINKEEESISNDIEKDESISYQKQLMELDQEGVKDFSLDVSINSLPKLQISFYLIFCILIIFLVL